MSDDPWRTWMLDPPDIRDWMVIEWIRDPDDEPRVARVADLCSPLNAAWNVAGVCWRPVA